MNNKTIHSFWISGSLSEMNLLTIKSFLANGHEFHLYCYNMNEVINSFDDELMLADYFIVKDARAIMDESEIYYYKNMSGGNPSFKFGGIAERLKAEMLFQLGGWHVDLDVTCLHNFETCINFQSDESWRVEYGEPNEIGMRGETAYPPTYVLRPHNSGGIVANIIKAPAESEFARRYVEHTKTITADNQEWEKSFKGLNQIVKDLNLEKYILPANILGDDSDLYYKDFTKKGFEPNPELHAIHHCAARQISYKPGSFYESLLIKYNLL